MKNEFIILRKVDNKGKVIHWVEINREGFYNLMVEIRDNFINNNVYSSMFVKEIPNISEISIDDERRADIDNPFVILKLEDGTRKTFYIPRWHRVIWAIMDELLKT